MMTYDEVLSRLDVRSRNGRTATALCPAHDDREPSLSVSVADHGGTVLYCHAGCPPDAILDAVGLAWADVQPDDPGWTPTRPLTRRTAARPRLSETRTEPTTIWTPEGVKALRAAQERLSAEPDHPLVEMVAERDGIDREALTHYGCGIMTDDEVKGLNPKWPSMGRAWLTFPYPTGAQLYRREGDGKDLYSLRGSTPKGAFFGVTRLEGAPDLIIVKSPRETMLLAAFEGIDVIGLPGGEKAELSPEQEAIIREIAPRYESIRVVMDCDTDKARGVASSFARAVAGAAHPVPVGMVDVTAATGGEHKDLTDVWRADGIEAVGHALIEAAPVDPPPDLHASPPIPRFFYAALHPELSAACEALREGHERDVFAAGLLPALSAAMPHVLTRYARQWKAVPLMVAVVATAGAGKGALPLARRVVEPVDRRLREVAEYELSEWRALDDKAKKSEPKPPNRRLILSADSSLRALTDGLIDNDGRGMIFETEIKVLASSLKQEWGDFKGMLLKAAEQEPYERDRKEEGPAYIPRPEIAVAMSGTPRSFTDWLEDAEDGLFSRFLFYTFEDRPVWHSQFEDETDHELDTALERIGERLLKVYNDLSSREADDNGRPVPLYLKIDAEGQRLVNVAFAELLKHVDENERPELYASVKRGAFQAVRVAGILAAYRLAADGADLSKAKSFSPSPDEVRAAVMLVRTLLSHASRLAERFRHDPEAKLDSEEQRRYYKALPGRFTTAEAQEVGRTMAMSTRKVERALSSMVTADLLIREKRGEYRKPVADTLPTPMAGLSEASEASEASERMPAAP